MERVETGRTDRRSESNQESECGTRVFKTTRGIIGLCFIVQTIIIITIIVVVPMIKKKEFIIGACIE